MIYRGTVSNGAIHLDDGQTLPEGTQVSVEPVAFPTLPDAASWPVGYFEQTFGSITDETFARPPQGEMPKAVDLA